MFSDSKFQRMKCPLCHKHSTQVEQPQCGGDLQPSASSAQPPSTYANIQLCMFCLLPWHKSCASSLIVASDMDESRMFGWISKEHRLAYQQMPEAIRNIVMDMDNHQQSYRERNTDLQRTWKTFANLLHVSVLLNKSNRTLMWQPTTKMKILSPILQPTN